MTETGYRPPKFKVGDRVVYCHLDRMPWPENTLASVVFVVVSHSVDKWGDDLVYFYSLVNEKVDDTMKCNAITSINSLISEDNLMEAPSLAWDQEAI